MCGRLSADTCVHQAKPLQCGSMNAENSQATKQYFLQVYGCQMNVSDAERIGALMERMGFQKTEREHEADVIGVVACSVRQGPIDRIYGQANKWKQLKEQRGTVTMLSGCVLEHDKPNMSKIFDVMFPIAELGKLPSLLSDRMGEDFAEHSLSLGEYFDVEPNYKSEFQAYVPISSGCNKFCTYCAVPYTRGGEISRDPDKIIAEVRHLVEQGYKEITLLGQNVNSYGLDFEGVILNLPERKVLKYKPNVKGELEVQKRRVANPMNFAGLLKAIANLPGDFWVRFVSSHPYDMSDELLETIRDHEKLTHYIHLPVQAGSNEVLKRMNRLYTIEHYRERLASVRRYLPDAWVTTDIIVGFPGETPEEFDETAKLMKEMEYDMAYIAQYSPRPGTVAARMKDDVPAEEKKRRDVLLNQILADTALKHNKERIGTAERVLVEQYRKGVNIGRASNGRKVHIKGGNRIGRFWDVRITDATPWHVVAKPVGLEE